MCTKSIRGRQLLWMAILLACILTGFGITAYQLARVSQFNQIDEQLTRRVAALSDEAANSPGPGHGPPRSPPGGGNFGPDRGPGGPPRDGFNDGGPPDQGNPRYRTIRLPRDVQA